MPAHVYRGEPMSNLDLTPARRWCYAAVCLLLLSACQRSDVTAGAAEPAAAVRQLATHLQQGELNAFARAAVPPAEHAALAQAWADGDSLWPLTGLPLDDQLPGLLQTLSADTAAADLRRAHQTQFAGQAGTLRQTAQALGLFGTQYVSHQGGYSAEQREHYRQLVQALSRWAGQAPLADSAQVVPVINPLVAAVQASGLGAPGALQAAGMEAALTRLGPVQQTLFTVLPGLGLDIAGALASLQASLLAQDGETAVVQISYTLAGQQIQFPAQMLRREGRWYLAQNLADAQQVLEQAALARQAREQAQAKIAEEAAAAAAEAAAADGKTAAGP